MVPLTSFYVDGKRDEDITCVYQNVDGNMDGMGMQCMPRGMPE